MQKSSVYGAEENAGNLQPFTRDFRQQAVGAWTLTRSSRSCGRLPVVPQTKPRDTARRAERGICLHVSALSGGHLVSYDRCVVQQLLTECVQIFPKLISIGLDTLSQMKQIGPQQAVGQLGAVR